MLVFASMRKVDKLLYLDIVPPFFIALAVLTFVFFSQKLGDLAELLITRDASPQAVLIIAGAIAPAILVFSLPLSYLIGVLIGLSGLSGESQITALRAGGVPLHRILRPILALGLLVGLATAAMSLIVLPRTNDIFNNIKQYISLRQATSQVVARVFNEDLPNLVFYLDDLSIDRQRWQRVFLADNSNAEKPRIVMAQEGSWVTVPGEDRLQLHLENGSIYEVSREDPAKDTVSHFAGTDIPVEINRGSAAASTQSIKPAMQMKTLDLWRGGTGDTPERRREKLIELHRRLALPFSVFGFGLVGLSLGICTRRGGRTSGSVMSLVLVILFYMMFINGLRLAAVGTLPPWLGAWGADIMLIIVGVLLLANAEQSSWLTQCTPSWRWTRRLENLAGRFHLGAVRTALQRLDDLAFSYTGRIARLRFPKVLDFYVLRGFFLYFFWAAVACYTLFVLFTLFDLLDDIIRNGISILSVVEYFVFLTPQIALLITPMAVLLAVLIQFGVLEKGSEVTAMKAGGWSLYRIGLPVFLLAGFFSFNLYMLQDYVLPWANVQQDMLRNFIKGRPPQTHTATLRKWMFGEADRIYNYEFFDPVKDTFIGLNIYEIDFHRLEITRHIHARRASVDNSGHWTLENGWIRDFASDRNRFSLIARSDFHFPEKADYFKKGVFEPSEASKLSYIQLKTYIKDLRQSGYNATELQVALDRKISFPFSCFIMVLLGVPFSFSMGKKGAFFGITASVGIAISYWGMFSVFEQMGAYGMLVPMLSAWAPNLLFGAAGLVLLLTIRT